MTLLRSVGEGRTRCKLLPLWRDRQMNTGSLDLAEQRLTSGNYSENQCQGGKV